MSDLDQRLKRAASDLRGAVRGVATATSSAVERRVRHRRTALATTVMVLVGLVGVGVLLAVEPAVDVAGQDGDTLITSEEILSDGVVTEAEYRAGAEAVVACLAEAGLEVEVSFDRPNGHATFSHSGAPESFDEAFIRCTDLHLSENVSLGWAATLGQLDITELREEISAVVACVEAKTGEDFGELTFDEFDYLTAQGQEVRDAALMYQEHQPWEECYSELGLEPDEPVEPHMTNHRDGSGALDVVERDGLVLTLSGPLDAPCVEVRTEREMAGGCGADLTDRLNVGIGGIAGRSFVYGWVTKDAATVVITLGDGRRVDVTELVPVEGLDVLFFLEVIGPMEGSEPELPATAIAVDESGEEVARFVLEEVP